MDDSGSDDLINTVSSDSEGSVRDSTEDNQDEVINVEVVSDSDGDNHGDAGDDQEGDDNYESDEVVVVDVNVVGDSSQSSEGADSNATTTYGGEDGDTQEPSEASDATAGMEQTPPLAPDNEDQNQNEEENTAHTSQHTLGTDHSQGLLGPPRSQDVAATVSIADSDTNPAIPNISTSQNPLDPAIPNISTSQNPSLQRSSASQGHNTSMDDFVMRAVRRPLTSVAESSNESVIEFRSPKRRRIFSPAKTSSSSVNGVTGVTGNNIDDNDDDDGNSCSICFEPWDNSGKHRLASLKCGHLFGLKCIEKWLKGQGGKCPSCNEKAKPRDIRVIYAKAIKMLDTTERDRALQELERERELRRRVELEAAQVRLQCEQHRDEGTRLRQEVDRLKQELSLTRSQRGGEASLPQASQSRLTHVNQLRGQFVLEKTIKIWEGGQCRVIAHCLPLAALIISQPSANHLFPGFGIKKLSCMDFKTSSYLTLHQKAVRGVGFHPMANDTILLSASMDKTVKLTSMVTNSVIQTYTAGLPLWSCEWNADDPNYFYVGQQNGQVLEFDTRNTAAHTRELNSHGSKSPVVSLQYMPRDNNAAFKPGGLIVGQLDRVTFFESKGDNDSRLHILPLEGNLTSLKVDLRTRHLLASFRPTARHPVVRHQLCELTSSMSQDVVMASCNVVHTFQAGHSQTVLSRTTLMPHPADHSRLLVVAGDERLQSALLWDSGTSERTQRLPCQGVPLDFAAFPHNSHTYLAALTDKSLLLHRWG